MTDQIKKIIKNYLNNAKLACLVQATKTADGFKVSETLTIPKELVHVPSWLKSPAEYPKTDEASVGEYGAHTHDYKQHIELGLGDKVFMLRDSGGQLFFVLDVVKA